MGKRQELRQRCHELAKRLLQLQQTQGAARRGCDQAVGVQDLRLTEFGPVAGCTLSTASPQMLQADASLRRSAEVAERSELRSIMERLERNAERHHLFASASGPMVAAF